jgi:hypothetical protein
MRFMPAFFIGLVLAGQVAAQSHLASIKKVAIVSLIGDEMTVDTFRPQTGTRLNVNDQAVLPLKTLLLDQTALLTTQEGLSAALKGAVVHTLAVPAPQSDFDPNGLFNESRFVADHPMLGPIQRAGYTHLVAISKLRAPARLRLADGATGSGFLRGVGFYVDDLTVTSVIGAGGSARGFIAPYAYFRVSLVDLTTNKVVNEERLTESQALSASELPQGSDPWELLTPTQKFEFLRRLTEAGAKRAVPLLLKAQP